MTASRECGGIVRGGVIPLYEMHFARGVMEFSVRERRAMELPLRGILLFRIALVTSSVKVNYVTQSCILNIYGRCTERHNVFELRCYFTMHFRNDQMRPELFTHYISKTRKMS